MSQQDLIRTIQVQQGQLNHLREQVAHFQSSNFEQKYKKALNQISGIVKANRQLKEELVKLSNFKSAENENFNKINKDELGKAYDKLLKQKNELLGQKEAMLLENQNLKRSVNNLQELVAKLKNQKMALAREKQGASKINFLEKSPEGGSSEKLRQKDVNYYKQKQTQMRKTLQNYEERHASLSRTNRKLEQQITELQNKIFKIQDQYKNKLNQKDIQLKVSKSAARQEYQGQIATLKKQVSQLKISNNELSMRVNSLNQEDRRYGDPSNQYEQQLIQTLRELKSQMEPMTAQIAQLQEKGQFDKQQLQRQRANLQIKVMEYQSQIQRLKQNQKSLQQRILKQNDKSRKWQESDRTLRKLEQQNRMLGGRVIVLQAKEVALRNRSGDQLEERVLQFQTRVQMLLNDKQTISNLKNVGIHQLIALKAYILQLDAKLKQVVNQNEYAVKKYKSYKQKCTQLIRELKQHDIAINALKGKLQGYDRLVVKLQGELQRAITINDNEMKSINIKISQSTMNSIDVYKKRYESLLEKLNLQQKYAEQEIQTLKLNYDTKLLDLNLKLEELSSVRQTIGLYKSKNQQLSNKLTLKENQLLQTKMTKVIITDTLPQSKNPHKQTINKLNETIHSKEGLIINLQNQLRKIEQEWKGKYSQLQQSNNAALSKKNREEQEKRRQIENLQKEIKGYRVKINQLQSKTSPVASRVVDDEHDYRKIHHISGKVSDLEVQLQDMKNRYQIQVAKVGKLNKANTDLKQVNGDLEGENSRLKFELKRIEKQMQMQLQDKDNQIRRIQINFKNQGDSRVIIKDTDNSNFKVNSLKMELQMLQSQAEQLQRDKTRYYNRTIQLERELSELNMKIEQLSYGLERAKNNVNNDLILQQTEKQQQIEKLSYTLKSLREKSADLEDRIGDYEQQISKLRNQLNRQRQRLATQLDHKDEQITKITRQLNRIRNDVTNQDDIRDGIKQQFQFKFNRMQTDNISLRDQIQSLQNQIQRLQNQVRFLRNRQMEYNSKAEGQQSYLQKLSNQLRSFQNKQVELESTLMDRESKISQLTNQLHRVRGEINDIQQSLRNKDSNIARLTAEVNSYRNNQFQFEIQIGNRQGDVNRLNSDLIYAKNRISDLQSQLQFVQTQVRKLRSQSTQNDQNYSNIASQIQQKELIILRLQTDVRSKSQQVSQLASQIEGKNQKLSELQGQFGRYRSASANYQSEVMQKNQQISKLTYQLNNIRLKYQNLEQQNENKQGNWSTLNRELASIRAQIGNYEDDLSMKDAAIQRYKGDIRDLTQQIQRLNDQIFQKNNSINKLNQELFRIKISGEEQSSQQIYKLQNEIYQLKSRVSTLQGQLDIKEDELSRARMEISQVRSNVSVNKYSDQEYQLLQTQFYQSQRSLTELRSQISQKGLQITQLQGKIQYMQKIQADQKQRFKQQRNDLQTQLQNVMNRERELRNKITSLQNDAYLTSNRNNDERQHGMFLYQQQCDRLTKITQQLQQEVNGLKLKLTYFTNQQDRIIQNLTVMTLTFAQVQALRQRMKTKQNEISEVRKSLINFATSSEDITSMSSRVVVKQRLGTDRSNKDSDSRNQSRQNLDIGSTSYGTMNKKTQTITYNAQLSSNQPTYYNYANNKYGQTNNQYLSGYSNAPSVNTSLSNQYGGGSTQYTYSTNQTGYRIGNTNANANQYGSYGNQISSTSGQYKSGDYTTYMSQDYKVKEDKDKNRQIMDRRQAQRKMENLQEVSSKYSSLRQSDYDDISVPDGGYNYQYTPAYAYDQDNTNTYTNTAKQYQQYKYQEAGSSSYATQKQPYSSLYTDVLNRGSTQTATGDRKTSKEDYHYDEKDFGQEKYEGNPDQDQYQQYMVTKTADRRLNELANSITGAQNTSQVAQPTTTQPTSQPANQSANQYSNQFTNQGINQTSNQLSVNSNAQTTQASGQLRTETRALPTTSSGFIQNADGSNSSMLQSKTQVLDLTWTRDRQKQQANQQQGSSQQAINQSSQQNIQSQSFLPQSQLQQPTQQNNQGQGQSVNQAQFSQQQYNQTQQIGAGGMLSSQTKIIVPNAANIPSNQSYPPAQLNQQYGNAPQPQPQQQQSLSGSFPNMMASQQSSVNSNQQQGSWRYSGSGPASMPAGQNVGQPLQQPIQPQTQPSPQIGLSFGQSGQIQSGQLQGQFIQSQQRTSQQQVKVQFGSSGNIGSSKALSPQPQPIGGLNQGQVAIGVQSQIQIQGGRLVGPYPPQNIQYPGFTR